MTITTTVNQEITTRGTIKVVVVETEVFGVKAWHCKCLTCAWQGARRSRNAKAVEEAKTHRCSRWGHA